MIKFGFRLLYVIMCLLWLPTLLLSPVIWVITGKPVMAWYHYKLVLVRILMK